LAWEFLRRNPDYQEAYSKLFEIHSTPRTGRYPNLPTEEEVNMLWSIIQRIHLKDGLFSPIPDTSVTVVSRRTGSGMTGSTRISRLNKERGTENPDGV
jgi:hypothetical protein